MYPLSSSLLSCRRTCLPGTCIARDQHAIEGTSVGRILHAGRAAERHFSAKRTHQQYRERRSRYEVGHIVLAQVCTTNRVGLVLQIYLWKWKTITRCVCSSRYSCTRSWHRRPRTGQRMPSPASSTACGVFMVSLCGCSRFPSKLNDLTPLTAVFFLLLVRFPSTVDQMCAGGG